MSNRFSYNDFVKSILVREQTPCSPISMAREAILCGAADDGDALIKKLRTACESLASQKGFKRKREKGISGYSYVYCGLN